MAVASLEDAVRDLDDILTFIGANYPAISSAFVGRLRMIERRIGRRPESAEEVEQRPGVRMGRGSQGGPGVTRSPRCRRAC
jgi:hypothetical protein